MSPPYSTGEAAKNEEARPDSGVGSKSLAHSTGEATQGQPGQQAGGQPASSSTDRPAAGRADKKGKSLEELLAEIIEEGEDEAPLVPPPKGWQRSEDE